MSAAKFWPRESRNLIGPLTIQLSTEVNCPRDLLTGCETGVPSTLSRLVLVEEGGGGGGSP